MPDRARLREVLAQKCECLDATEPHDLCLPCCALLAAAEADIPALLDALDEAEKALRAIKAWGDTKSLAPGSCLAAKTYLAVGGELWPEEIAAKALARIAEPSTPDAPTERPEA